MHIVYAKEVELHPNCTFTKQDRQITLRTVLQAQVDLGPVA